MVGRVIVGASHVYFINAGNRERGLPIDNQWWRREAHRPEAGETVEAIARCASMA